MLSIVKEQSHALITVTNHFFLLHLFFVLMVSIKPYKK